MTRPTPDRIGAAIDAMRAEGGLWQAQSDRLDELVTRVNTLRITGVGRTYVFDPFMGPYYEVIRTFMRLLVDGKYATRALGEKLIALAAEYEAEEAANLHALHRLY
jgi:hypothetical protein